MPDPLIASAFVRIKPEPKSVSGFGKSVRGAIQKSFERPVTIPVQAKLLPFKKKFQTELNSAVFTIKVTPVLAPGFKAQVSRLAKEAAAGVAIPVTPVGKAGAAAAAAAKPATGTATRGAAASTAASREAVFQKKLKDLTDARTIAATKLNAALQTEGTVEQRLAEVAKAESAAKRVLNTHTEAQVKLEGSLTQKQAARLATAEKRAQADLAAASAARAGLEGTIATDAANRKLEASANAVAAAELRRAKIAGQLLAVNQAGDLVEGRVAIERAKLAAATNVLTAAEKLHVEALALEDATLIASTASLVEKAEAERLAQREAVRTAIADEKAAAATAARVAVQKQLERGLLATALAAAGARGATLAAGSSFLVGAAIATGLFKSVQLAERLQQELNIFRVTAGATAEQIDAVAEKAQQLGADLTLPSVSANQAANAMTELAKAGLSVQDSMDAARGTLQLATAAQLDNETAVNITASALNAFGLAGNQAVHVADLLAGASNAAQGGIGDMGGALSSVASVARQAGLSIEDTVSFLTLLAKNGIQGAEAGTALRVALIRLIAPTKKANDELSALGVNVLDSFGQVRPEVFADIATATNKLEASQRNAALQVIFGTRAIRAQAVIGREGAVGLNAMREATNQSGLAAELAGARTEGFGGKVEGLKNTAATAGLNIGELLIPPLGLLVDSLNLNITVIDVFLRKLKQLATLDFAFPGKKQAAEAGGGFFDFFGGVGRGLDKLTADIPGVNQFFDPVTGKSEEAKRALDDLGESIAAVSGNFVPLATQIQGAFSGGGEQDAVKFVQDLESKITSTTPHAEELMTFLEGIVGTLTALGRAPTEIELKALFDKGFIPDELAKIQERISSAPPIEVKAGFAKDSVVFLEHAADNAAAKGAQNAHDKFASVFGSEIANDPLGQAVWDPFFLNAKPAAEKAAEDSAKTFSSSFQDQLGNIQVRGGGSAAELAFAQGQLPGATRRFERAQARFEKSPTKEHKAFRDFARDRLQEIQETIKSATSDIETASKAGEDKLTKARNEADQRFLDALGLGRGRIENRILIAEGSAGVADDIKRHTELRNFLKKKLNEASKTIKDAQTKAETVQSLTTDLINENQKIKELNQQLVDSLAEAFEAKISIAEITGSVGSIRKIYAAWINALQKALAEATKGSKLAQDLKLKILETQKAAFSAINEGFELDIEIAQAQERPRAEIRARERFIEQLRREQDQFRRGSLEWKRLQLEIINQQKAIEEAGKASKDKNSAIEALQRQEFEFLQTMQGFTGNLLGNLIPGGIGGLVGGTVGPPPSAAAATGGFGQIGGPQPGGGVIPGFGAKAGAAVAAKFQSAKTPGDAEKVRGFTSGQGNKTNHLLMQILAELHKLNRGSDHPEAKKQRQDGSAKYDYSPTGQGCDVSG